LHTLINGMKSFCGIVLLIILFIIASGCTGPAAEPATTPATPAASLTVTAVGTPIPASAPAPLAELSSTNPNASLTLDPGTAIVAFDATTPGKMTFSTSCGPDWGAFYEIEIASAYAGTLPFEIPAHQTCMFNITGPAPWTAQVDLPDTAAPLAVPVNLSGSGTQVSPLFTLEQGEYIFQRGETGIASPAYEIRYTNGSFLMDATNTYVQPHFGLFSEDTFQIISVPESGTYFLGTIARSNPRAWNVSILAVPAIPAMGPGPELTSTP